MRDDHPGNGRLLMLLTSLQGDQPDHPSAVRVGEQVLSRGALSQAAGAVADEVAGSARVAVLATPALPTVVAVVGCLLAGAAVVPVPPDAGPVERAHILTDSAAQLWYGERPADVTLPARTVDLTARPTRSHPEPAGDATAFVLYTSGTTGAPKGVLLSHDAVRAGLDGLAQAWDWSPDDVLVHGLPLFHVHGLILGVLGALRVGSPLVHTVRATPAAYAAAAGTLYFGVPTIWGRVCAEPASARALGGARLLVSGSAALPVPVFEGLRELTGMAPVERYGMSETLITLSTRADGERRPGWVGRPLPGVHTRLRDDDGAAVPADGRSIGELQLRCPTMFDGYLNRPDATAATWTTDGWFCTGDAAVIDDSGFHRVVGRRSVDLISSGGYRIGAGEVEAALLSHPGVREAAVVGEPDPDLGQRVVAYVVCEGLSGVDLAGFAGASLSTHKRPRAVHVVDALPRNAMGKVQKALLAGRGGWATPTVEPMSTDDTSHQARKGLLDSISGKAKEVFGALSGNDSLTAEGQLQQKQAADRKEASSTQSLAQAQAQEAAENLADAHEAGARERSAAEQQAAAKTAQAQAEHQAKHRQAERQQEQETAVAQSAQQRQADAQVRASAVQASAQQAAAAGEAVHAVNKHERAVADAAADEAEAERARRAADAITREEGLE